MVDFSDLLDRHGGMIGSILKKHHISRDYEDFEQLCVIALWEADKNYDPLKGVFATYAYAKMQGAVIQELRKRGKYIERHCSYEPQFYESTLTSSDEITTTEWQIFLDTQNLSTQERNILTLKLHGHTLQHISLELSLTINQVKKKLYSLKERLRNWL